MQTANQRVAEFVAAFTLEQAPTRVLEKAKVTVLHDLGVALAGHALAAPAVRTAKQLSGNSGSDGARILVDGGRVAVDHAVLATAAIMHARTQDDTQLSAMTHLGCTTLPALLALGDNRGSSGTEFLTAMVAGYEAATAIADGFAGRSTDRGFRATSIYGPFAAAAACSRLLGLSAERTDSALGLAAAFGGGTNQTWVAGTQEWQYQVGMASRSGLTAALLAAQGVTGAPDALEGPAGHYKSFAGGTDGADRVGAALGSQWTILDVTYKPYPVCAINQAPVTLLVSMRHENGITADRVRSVRLSLNPSEAAYPGTDSQGPFADRGAALMSAPFCLAVALIKGDFTAQDLTLLDDRAVNGLASRVKVVADDSLSSGSCRLDLTLDDGNLVSKHIPDAATFNWDRTEAARRVRSLTPEMALSEQETDDFIDLVLDLEHRDVRDLVTATLPRDVREQAVAS